MATTVALNMKQFLSAAERVSGHSLNSSGRRRKRGRNVRRKDTMLEHTFYTVKRAVAAATLPAAPGTTRAKNTPYYTS